MQFHYPKVTCTYKTNIDNDYFSIDFVAWGRKRPPSEIQGGANVRGIVFEELMSYTRGIYTPPCNTCSTCSLDTFPKCNSIGSAVFGRPFVKRFTLCYRTDVLSVPPFPGGAWSPSNTMSPGPRLISLPSGILIHPAVWSQETWAENGRLLYPFPWVSWVPI